MDERTLTCCGSESCWPPDPIHATCGRATCVLSRSSIGIGEIGKDQGLDEVRPAQLGLALDKAGLTGEALGHLAEHIL